MAESLVEEETEKIQKPRRDVYDMVLRALIGMLLNFAVGRLKKRQELKKERRKAERQVAKLKKKGKEIPDELLGEVTRGLSRHRKKKYARKAKKARGKKRHWIIVAIAIVIVLVVRFAKK